LLVAIYSVGYMRGDPGYWRFFAYIGLFVFSMTMLVSVSNFLLLFVFWEAVGVCSYLLIGFWYRKPAAAAAGTKAFLVNRIGDFGFMLGVFLIWTTYGTLNYHDTAAGWPSVSARAGTERPVFVDLGRAAAGEPGEVVGVLSVKRESVGGWRGGGVGLAICLLLLLGACGKSAQFPLHVWLPDAMEGPTPVSALIHAATMVTAGVYMIARCAPLFVASPDGLLVVAGVGTFTALLAASIALTQFDLKRVLAYSTISQLGYMFLGLGTGTLAGMSAGMFHLFTHAFFKALLFLGAGSVMHAMGNVIDMRRFGGLRRRLPHTYRTFLVGCLALAGIIPLSGFWSKDSVLFSVHARAHEMQVHWARRQAAEERVSSGTAGSLPAAGHAARGEVEAGSGMSDGELARAARLYAWMYYGALLTAFLTAFYAFRALFLTFFGDERLPGEAADHGHESPGVMVWPLAILAFFAACVGLAFDQSWLNGTHPFAEVLADTPSLSGAVARTETLGSFHFSVAVISTICAVAGALLASCFYLGDRRAAAWFQAVMDFRVLKSADDGARIARVGQQPWIQAIDRAARRVGLPWLTRLAGDLLIFTMLVITAPLLLIRFVSPYRLSFGKFFLDETYSLLVVRPLRGLAWLLDAVDRWLVDGLVDLVGQLPSRLGALLRTMQTGLVPFYAMAMILGGLIMLLTMNQQFSEQVMLYLHRLLGGMTP
ncbi:MAG: NADH-quinone oxidoreductase subunit L, partial [Planctomycetes bacterium]|nr:NADH-quinone oxidoreductase subunit L [Planctomycetota bacterium]